MCENLENKVKEKNKHKKYFFISQMFSYLALSNKKLP